MAQGFLQITLLAACVSLASTAPAADETRTTLAVVTADDLSRALSDLLSAELSQEPRLQLVERDRIRAALTELKLSASGRVAAEQRVRLGSLVAADVVLFVESAAQMKPPQFHLSAVESRTGLQLLDLLLPAANVEQASSAAAKATRPLLGRSKAQDESRVYVAFTGVRSEEPGAYLLPMTQALTTLLRHDLQRSPRVFLLERERLRQLATERDLTGIDLTLQASALVADAALRRKAGGAGYDVTLRVSSINRQRIRTARVQIASTDISETRQRLREELVSLLGTAVDDSRPASRQEEAAAFAARAQWLGRGRDLADAVAAAECAFALQPNADHGRLLYGLQFSQVNSHLAEVHKLPPGGVLQRRKASRKALHDALIAQRRCYELDLWRLRLPGADIRREAYGNPFQPHVPRLHPSNPDREPPLAEEPLEMQELRRDNDALRREKLTMFVDVADRDPRILGGIAIHELQHTDYFAKDAADFVRRVLAIQARVDRYVAELKDRSTPQGDSSAESLRAWGVAKLADQLKWTYNNRSSTRRDHPQWPAADLLPLWMALFEHSDPRVCALGCLALCQLEDHRPRAVQRAIEVLPHVRDHGTDLCLHIRDHLQRTQELEDVLEGLVSQAEADGRSVSLGKRTRLIIALLTAIGTDKHDWHRRMQVLASRPVTIRTPNGHLELAFKAVLDQYLSRLAPRPRTSSGLTLSGAWNEYSLRVIQPKRIARSLVPLSIGASGLGDGEFWALYPGKSNTLDIARLSLTGGGDVSALGKCSYHLNVQRSVVAAASQKNVFVSTGQPGLACLDLGSKQITEFETEDGYLGGSVSSMASVGGKLYYLSGGLCEFDPTTKQFRLLASQNASAARGPFDGPNNFSIKSLLGDETRSCLWFCSNATERRGIWKYLPATQQFELVFDAATAQRVSNPIWHGGAIKFFVQYRLTAEEASQRLKKMTRSEIEKLTPQQQQALFYLQRLITLDPADNAVKKFAGYADRRLDTPFLLVGDHVVCQDGKLFTPDGQLHDLQPKNLWRSHFATSHGFIAFRGEDLLVFTRKMPSE